MNPNQANAKPGTCVLLDPAAADPIYAGPLEPQAEPKPVELTAREAADLWERLALPDAREAALAAWQLTAARGQVVSVFKDRLTPIKPPDPEAVRAVAAGLGAPDWKKREATAAELRLLGGAVAPELRKIQTETGSPEVRSRIDGLVKEFEAAARSAPADPATLRDVRAVRMLSRVGTPAAEDLLRELAAGLPGAPRTVAAKAALEQIEAAR
jgi:hypothetical protein